MQMAIRQFGITPDVRKNREMEGWPSTCMGLELEYDDANIPRTVLNDLRYWETREEGSLSRDGVELVFAQPYMGEDIHDALTEIDRVIIPRINRVRSPNHSMHCHMDMRDVSSIELAKVVLASVAVEPILFEVFGNERKRNIFCLSYTDSVGDYTRRVGALLGDVLCGKFVTENALSSLRYSSISLASLFRFGSLEFRLASATYDVAVMRRYMTTLQIIKDVALGVAPDREEPSDIFDVYNTVVKRAVHRVGDILGINYKGAREMTRQSRMVVELILETTAETVNRYTRRYAPPSVPHEDRDEVADRVRYLRLMNMLEVSEEDREVIEAVLRGNELSNWIMDTEEGE